MRPAIAAALALLAMLLPATAVAAPHWSSPVRVAPPAPHPGIAPPRAFVTTDGRSLAISGDTVRPFLLTGVVTGQFGDPAPLGRDEAGLYAVDADLGADGTLAIAWAVGGAAHVTVVPPGQPPRPQADFAGEVVSGAAVGVSDDGAVTVAWRTKSADSVYGVMAATAPPGGAFGAPFQVDGAKAAIDQIDVAGGPGGAAAIVFRKQGPRYRTHVAVRDAGAAAFTPGQAVSSGEATDLFPSVAFDRDGTVLAAWGNQQAAGYAVRAPGAPFGPPAPLGPPGEFVSAVALARMPSGGTAAAWLGGDAIRAAVRPQGGGFGSASTIAPSATNIVSELAVAAAPDGAVTVLFGDPGDGGIRATILGEAPELIGYGAVERPTPVALAASADRTVALWRDAGGGLSAATRSEQAPPSTGPGPRPAAPDRLPPRITVLGRTRRIAVTRRTRRIRVRIRVSEAATIQTTRADLRTTARGRRRLAPMPQLRARKVRRGRHTVTLKLGRLARRDLRRALAVGRGGIVRADLEARDAAQNSSRTQIRLILQARRR